MALADVDSAAMTGHSVDGDSRMFLTRASRSCAAGTDAALAMASPGPGAGLVGGGVGPAASGRGAIAAADMGSAGAEAGWFGAAIVAPQKLQNRAPSATCLPH